MYNIKKGYVDLFLYMNSDSNLIGELGKGRYDSIVPELINRGFNAIAITPYARSMNMPFTFYDGKITFMNHQPIIHYSDNHDQSEAPNISDDSPYHHIDTLVTQLPIGNESLQLFIKSSCRYNDVVIGTYGFLDDKDRKEKMSKLQKIKTEIESSGCVYCDVGLVELNGTYQYIIKSNQKSLIKMHRF